MLDKNKAIHEFTGVSRFHAAGYTGSRVKAATGEALVKEDWPGPGRVEELLNKGEDSTSGHCKMTAAVFFEVAPDATLYRASNDIRRNQDGSYTFDLYDVFLPEMEELGITLMFTSESSGSPGQNEVDRANCFAEENDWFTPFWAAGNDGDDTYNGKIRLSGNVGVSAYSLVEGKAIPKSYSSESEYVAFSAPTDIAYQLNGQAVKTGGGTSAATPYLCGMAALVQDFFIDKTGRPLKREALLRFLRDNCIDLEEPGRDSKTGYGAVILTYPAEIDVWKYQEGVGEKDMRVEDFKDASEISEWAKDGIQTCLDLGIMNGIGDGLFDPQGTVTREQLATTLARMLEVNL